MRISTFFENRNHTEHQIRPPESSLYALLLVVALFLLAALVINSDRVLYIGVAVFVLLYGSLSFYNDRVSYDDSGITRYSIWGKPFYTHWNDVLKVEIAEEPLISKQLFIGRVLRIHCRKIQKIKSTVITYRFPYKYYIGIDDFLSFVKNHFPEYI